MITSGVLVVALTSAIPIPTAANPAEIHSIGSGRWQLTPLAAAEYKRLPYSAVEILFRGPLLTVPVVTVHEKPLRTNVDQDVPYIVALSEVPFFGEDVVLLSENEPIQAAFMFKDPPKPADIEQLSAIGPHVWAFSTPGDLPEPWRFDNPDTRLCRLDARPYVIMRTGTSHTIRTTQRWSGLSSWRFPVMIIQMHVGSGVGSGKLLWRDSESREGSWMFRLPRRGDWMQLILPLIRHPLWRGTIQQIELSPATHGTAANLDWIQIPSVAPIWALLLKSTVARWLALGCLFLGCLMVVLTVETHVSARTVSIAAVAGCAIIYLFLPFNELRPAFRLGSLAVPSSVPLLAVIALLRRRRTNHLVDFAAWLCVVVTLSLGLVVAQGAAIQPAIELIALPLAFLAGRAVAKRGLNEWIVFILAGSTSLLCLHAIIFSSVSDDPIYGSLLTSLGRAYWDATVFGRSAGAFVHPLVLATGATTLGMLILSTRLARKRLSLAVVGILLVGAICSGSRVFLALLGMTILGTALRKNVRYAVMVSLIATASLVLFLSRVPHDQGLLRDLHLVKRIAGLEVTAKTLEAKPVQGVGWGRYRRAVHRFGSPKAKVVPFTTPDNSFARVFTEGGLLGGSIWIGWMVLVIHASCRKKQNPQALFPSWAPSVFFVVMWLTFDAAYWQAACVPAFAALGSTTE